MLLGILESNNFVLVFPGKSGSKTFVTDIVGPDWHYKRHYLDVREWVSNFDTTKLNILVTRNPAERYKSGATSHWMFKKFVNFDKWMSHHGDPYMKYIPDLPFKIIQFENLWFDSGKEPRNPARDRCDYEMDNDEFSAWKNIVRNKEEITELEWQKLKESIIFVNYPNNKDYYVKEANYEGIFKHLWPPKSDDE